MASIADAKCLKVLRAKLSNDSLSPSRCLNTQGCTIALDVMSGDDSPQPRVHAALRALVAYPHLHITLVGDQELISSYLSSTSFDHARLKIIHAKKTIGMDLKPSLALRDREDTSMWIALQQIAINNVSACVSAGNTGALMAMGRFALKTFSGIDRPAIAGTVPSVKGSVLLLDMGANVDCSASNLYQFAVMGSQLFASMQGISSPKVGLLNVGTEDIKGNEQVKTTHLILKKDTRINYIGNIEGHEVFSGKADVVVCDGFVGNIALKTGEGLAYFIRDRLISTFRKSLWGRILSLMAAPIMKNFYKSIDPVIYSGASFLGLQGILVKSHGHSGEEEFFWAIGEAVRQVESNMLEQLEKEVVSMLRE